MTGASPLDFNWKSPDYQRWSDALWNISFDAERRGKESAESRLAVVEEALRKCAGNLDADRNKLLLQEIDAALTPADAGKEG